MSNIRSPRKRGLRRFAAAAAGLALIATVAACSPGTSNEGGDGGETPAAELADTLNFGAVGGTTDSVEPYPARVSAFASAMHAQIYEGLTVFDREGAVQMALAESIEPNDSLDVWTIELRQGVMKHDGEEFTADDVIWSLDYILNPDNAYASSREIDFIDRERIEKVDDHTIVLNLNRPYGPLPAAFASGRVKMAGEGASSENPIGTGPFVLQTFTQGQQAELTRFDDYWGEKPGFENLKMIAFQDQAAMSNALRGGQIHVSATTPLTEVPAFQGTAGITLLESPTMNRQFLTFRVDLAPFDDPRVREAMRLIIDRDLVLENAYNGNGVIANDINGNNSHCAAPNVPQREQDLDRAKELLEEAGQSNLSFEIVTDGGFVGMMEMAQLFSQSAAEIGVNVQVTKLDSGAFLAKWREWPALVSTTSNTYFTLAPRYYMEGGENNASHWADPEYADLAAKLFATADPDEQCNYIQQMQEIEWERGVDVIPVFPNQVIAHSSKVHGLQADINGRGAYTFNGVTVEK